MEWRFWPDAKASIQKQFLETIIIRVLLLQEDENIGQSPPVRIDSGNARFIATMAALQDCRVGRPSKCRKEDGR